MNMSNNFHYSYGDIVSKPSGVDQNDGCGYGVAERRLTNISSPELRFLVYLVPSRERRSDYVMPLDI